MINNEIECKLTQLEKLNQVNQHIKYQIFFDFPYYTNKAPSDVGGASFQSAPHQHRTAAAHPRPSLVTLSHLMRPR